MNKVQQLACTCHICELLVAVCAIITGIAQLTQIHLSWKSAVEDHQDAS